MGLELKPVMPSRQREAEAPPEPKPASKPKRDSNSGSGGEASPPARPKPAAAAVERSAPRVSRPRLQAGSASPYGGERREQVSLYIYEPLWEQLELRAGELAEGGARASAASLLVALLHFHLPEDPGESLALGRSFRLALAGIDGEPHFDGERPGERNVRLFESQRTRLDAHSKRLCESLGERPTRTLLINAVIDGFAPPDSASARRLLRAFELAQLGEPEAAAAILS